MPEYVSTYRFAEPMHTTPTCQLLRATQALQRAHPGAVVCSKVDSDPDYREVCGDTMQFVGYCAGGSALELLIKTETPLDSKVLTAFEAHITELAARRRSA